MKTKSFALLTAGAVTLAALTTSFAQDSSKAKPSSSAKEPTGSRVVGFNGIEKATPITQEEAMKKYPPRGKNYPTADVTKGPDSGGSTTDLESPYPPHHRFDCSNISHGGLVFDPYSKHVFIKP